MNQNAPSLTDWRRLYDAACEFKALKCWEWIFDSDIFGVKDPESGEIAFCSIMGNGGEHFGIAGYLGAEGLDCLLGMLSGEITEEDPNWLLYKQKCLMCSFEDREFLEKEDKKVIAALGLSFRGHNAWPLFRTYEPGYYPWFINADQCRFLTLILQQALSVATRIKNDKSLLRPEKNPAAFLVRVPQKRADELIWHDEYQIIDPPSREYVSFKLSDELIVRRFKKFPTDPQAELEIDIFYAPIPVMGEDRPYFPLICLIMQHIEGLVVSFEMLKDIDSEGFGCIKQLLEYIDNIGKKPSRILFTDPQTGYLFTDICNQIGIRLDRVKKLKNVEDFRRGLLEHMSR